MAKARKKNGSEKRALRLKPQKNGMIFNKAYNTHFFKASSSPQKQTTKPGGKHY